MIDISVQNVCKFYGDREVLSSVSFDVQAGGHIGLLGANGVGKTTLLRIINGDERADSGIVAIPKGRNVGMLSQIPHFDSTATTEDVLISAFKPILEIQSQMEAISSNLHTTDSKTLKHYGDLAHRFEAMGGFEIDLKLSKVKNGLNINNTLYKRLFNSLSGGEKTRVNLARLILEETDILLLDEPTNHLDMHSIEWLEEYLSKYKGTVICVSHDRYFLDGVIMGVVELERGVSHYYSGNYSFYAEEKHRRILEQTNKYIKDCREISRLEETARRMHDYAGKNAKLHKRAFAIEKRAARIHVSGPPPQTKSLKAHFKTVKFLADDILRIEKLSHAFNGRYILKDLSASVRPGDKIALLGVNGAGKTTLLKIILGYIEPVSGRICTASTAKPAYLPQVITWHHPERTLIDTLIYEENCSPQEARDRLGMFHFSGEDVFKTVDKLSGGERSRLKLCMMMGSDVNLLFMDEPTNHLDIASREWMEEIIDQYGETLIFVSHDRYFTARFATRVWLIENGTLTDFHGDYEDFKTYLQTRKPNPGNTPKIEHNKNQLKKHEKRNKSLLKQKIILESQMKTLEKEEAMINWLIDENSSNASKLEELLKTKEALETQWQEVFVKWEELDEI